MQIFQWSVALTLALIAGPCHAFTYWVSPGCAGKPNFNEYLKETFEMAEKANNRMNSATDTDFAAVYKRIFKVDKSDRATFEKVDNLIGSLALDWGQTDDQADSNVRIHCDNDGRWELAKDENGVVHKSGGKDVYFDPSNFMLSVGPFCNNPGPKFKAVWGMNSATPSRIAGSEGHRATRNTITICDSILNKPDQSLMKFRDLAETKDLTLLDEGIEFLKLFVPMVLFHEFTHAAPYNRVDIPYAYGWGNIMTLDTEEAIMNADHYAYVGAWAWFADRGYTLPRIGNAKSEQEKANDQLAFEGKFALYRDLTKRWAQRVMKRFRA